MSSPTKDHRPAHRRFAWWHDSLGKSAERYEAEQLQAEASAAGGTLVADLTNREMARVCGAVRSVTLPPTQSVPAVWVELYDGSRPLNLVWLGRRRIRGIEPGVFIRATGRVTTVRGVPTIYNPSYAIVPDRD